ncbi:MAG: hypothetical protein KAH17_09085, partial [Bacteroidales bacterium]|nr:hypothetical protein [Bacteroidales bacterium]
LLTSATVGTATVNVRTDNTQTQEWDGRIITIKDGTGDCTTSYKIVFNPGPSAISVDGAWGCYLGSGSASVRLQYSATTGDWHLISSFGTVAIY